MYDGGHKEELNGVHNCKELHIFHASDRDSRKSHVRPILHSTGGRQDALVIEDLRCVGIL